MKLGNLLRVRRTISAHSRESISAPLAYKFMKFMKASDSEDAFYVSQVKEIIAKYEDKSVSHQAEGSIKIQADKVQICQDEINQLEQMEVEAPIVYFSLAELRELKLTVMEVFSLDEIIKEEG